MCCIVMRNWDQVRRYHLEAIKRDFPWLMDDIISTMPAHLDIGKSRLDFSYAESLDDVKRRFMSGNYAIIAIDQAEQFTIEEIREVRRANRIKGGKPAKLILSFNMRGSSIQELRKWFLHGEVLPDENPDDYKGFKWNPWDNHYWCEAALIKDGYTVTDYYNWTDDQRKSYAAAKGQYTKQLATDDEAIRQSDWEGSWDSVEGTFFSSSWDLQATRINQVMVERLHKPWSNHWISIDWGKAHFTGIQWHYRTLLSPGDAQILLNWNLTKPISVIVTYREHYVNELESSEVAKVVAGLTPPEERKLVRAVYLDPSAFSDRDSPNTTAIQISKVLRENQMPGCSHADNDRKGGYSLMGMLFKATKGHGYLLGPDDKPFQANDVVFIADSCPELINSIPLLMRDPKSLEDVLKTDKTSAKIEMDSTDCFVADTLIHTQRGHVPIEHVHPGDYVMTRSGWKRVIHSWKSRSNAEVVTASFSDGAQTTCTQTHKFYTDTGFLPLCDIRYGDKLYAWHSGRQSSIVGLHTTATLSPNSSLTAGTSWGSVSTFIARCGSMNMARSLKAFMYTMSTAITAITRSVTSSAFCLLPTNDLMFSVESGRLSANSAEQYSSALPSSLAGSAPTPVSPSGAGITKSTMYPSLVSCVAQLFSGTDTISAIPAA